jgi:hypothetical protein
MLVRPKKYEGRHPRVVLRDPYTGQFAVHRNTLFQTALRLGADPTSEFYHRDSRTQTLYRRTGASARTAFWAGYDEALGQSPNPLLRGHPTSDASVMYAAGVAFGRADKKLIEKEVLL